MFYPNEIANLLFGIVGTILLFLLFRKAGIPRFRLLASAFLLILAANLLTVAEGVLWGDFLNLLEHMSYAAAGLVFAVACLLLRNEPRPDRERH